MGVLPDGRLGSAAALARWVQRHDVDIQRIFRRLPQADGEPWSPAGSLGGRIGLGKFLLAEPLYRGQTAEAEELAWNGSEYASTGVVVTIEGQDAAKGYWFAGDRVSAELVEDAGRWFVLGSGSFFARGINGAAPIAAGGSGNRTLTNGESVLVHALDQIRASKAFAVWWDDDALAWYGSGVC